MNTSIPIACETNEFRTAKALLDYLKSIPNIEEYILPEGDVIEVKRVERRVMETGEVTGKHLSFGHYYRGGHVVDLTEDLDEFLAPDPDIDAIPGMD